MLSPNHHNPSTAVLLALDQVSDAVIIWNPKINSIVLVNRAFGKLSGIESNGISNVTFLSPESQCAFTEAARLASSTNLEQKLTVRLMDFTITAREYDVTLVPHASGDVVCLFRDPNPLCEALERRAQEQQCALLEQEVRRRTAELEAALQVKSRFVATMSHEMRTPLTGIMGGLTQLADSALIAQHQELREAVNIAQVCGDQLQVVIDDVLEHCRLEENRVTLQPTAVSLRAVLGDALDMVSNKADEKRLALILDFPHATQDQLMLDAGRFKQILLNLLGNAVKFTERGHVVLRARSRDLDSDTDECEVEVEVEDTGIGIPENQRPHLFQAFEQGDGSMTRRFGGSGLGLHISRRLAELMGGSIAFDSVVGRGSRFWLRVRVPKIPGESPSGLATSMVTPGMRVLLVEGNEALRQVLQTRLLEWGFELLGAVPDAEEALRLLRPTPPPKVRRNKRKFSDSEVAGPPPLRAATATATATAAAGIISTAARAASAMSAAATGCATYVDSSLTVRPASRRLSLPAFGAAASPPAFLPPSSFPAGSSSSSFSYGSPAIYNAFASTLAPPGPLLQPPSPQGNEPLLIIDACLPPGQIRLLRTGRDAILMGPLWLDRLSLLKEGLVKFIRKPIRDEVLFQTLLDYFLCGPSGSFSSPSSSGSPSQSVPLALGMPLSFAPLTPPPSALLAMVGSSSLSMPQLPGVNPLSRLRLLLAEDNPMNQTVIRKLLCGFGITDPFVANNGREAVEMAVSEPRGFDVILMDIMMPEMNGLEAAVRIRKELQSVGRPVPPILALTANAFLEDHIKCIEAGMERVLTKPIKKDELHDALLTIAATLSTSARARSSRGSFDASTTVSPLSSISPSRPPV